MAKIDMRRNMHPADYSHYVDNLDYNDVRNIMVGYVANLVFDEEVYYHAWDILDEWPEAIDKLIKDFEKYGNSAYDDEEDILSDEFNEYVHDCAYQIVEKYDQNGIYDLPYDVLYKIMSINDLKKVAEHFDTINEEITQQDVIDYVTSQYDFSRAIDIACDVVDGYLNKWYGQ